MASREVTRGTLNGQLWPRWVGRRRKNHNGCYKPKEVEESLVDAFSKSRGILYFSLTTKSGRKDCYVENVADLRHERRGDVGMLYSPFELDKANSTVVLRRRKNFIPYQSVESFSISSFNGDWNVVRS